MRPAPNTAEHGPVLRVCIIEDHEIVRSGIRMLIEREPDLKVVFDSATASQVLAQPNLITPDIILLDLSLDTESGVDMIPALLQKFRSARIVVLTANDEAEAHVQALQLGAQGVVMKDQAPEILVRTIQSVASGDSWIESAAGAAARSQSSRSRPMIGAHHSEAHRITSLTPVEKEVIQFVAEGFNRKRIAYQLRIPETAVRNHLTSILAKLGVSNELELVVYAVHHGLGSQDNKHI